MNERIPDRIDELVGRWDTFAQAAQALKDE